MWHFVMKIRERGLISNKEKLKVGIRSLLKMGRARVLFGLGPDQPFIVSYYVFLFEDVGELCIVASLEKE